MRILIKHILLAVLLKRPHRLAVRIPGFHPGGRGSIPRGVTMKYVLIYQSNHL
jgi:hypothetical protein